MRILIPLLLLAGLGVGYFAFRRDSDADTSGAGPQSGAAAGTTSTQREPLVLDRGQAAARSAAAQAEPTSAQSPTGAPVVPSVQPTQEPVFTNGVTNDPAGTLPPTAGGQDFVEKYRDASRAMRVQAYDALRQAVDIEFARSEKGSVELAAEMKREMEWLQEHFEPETP